MKIERVQPDPLIVLTLSVEEAQEVVRALGAYEATDVGYRIYQTLRECV